MAARIFRGSTTSYSNQFCVERGANYNIGWFASAVISRVVNDLDGAASTTRYCYAPYLRNGDTPPDVSTYVLDPHRLSKYSFFRERRWDFVNSVFNPDAWKEGVPTGDIVFNLVTASTSCATVLSETGLVKRSETKTTWGRGASSVVTSFPFYPEATVAPRRVTEQIVDLADTGKYTTQYSNFDTLLRPLRKLETLANSPNAKVTNTTYIAASQAAGRLDRIDTVSVDAIAGNLDNDYDNRGNLIKSTNYGVATIMGYFANGNLQSVEDARGNKTMFANYRFGAPQLVTHPDQTTSSQEIDVYGRTTSMTNERGVTTSFTYDLLDRLATVTPVIGPSTEITWSSNFQTKTVKQKSNKITLRTDTYQFDGLGRLISETQAGLLVTKRNYDDSGRLISLSDVGNGGAVGRTVSTYDALDRAVATARYDASNNLVWANSTAFQAPETRIVTDNNGNATTLKSRSYGGPSYSHLTSSDIVVTTYNNAGVASSKVVATDLTPDVLGFSPFVTQGERSSKGGLTGVTRRYELNSKRQLISEYAPEIAGSNFAGGYNVSLCRDEVGNLVGKSLNAVCTAAASANLLTNSYDPRNRLQSTIFAANGAPSKTIEYSNNSNIEKITRSNGVVLDPQYNELDQLSAQDYLLDTYKFRVRFEYDGLQNLKTLIYPTGKRISFDPDVLGRAKKVLPYVSNIDYFEVGPPKEITYANGQVTTVKLTTQNLVDTLKTQKNSVVPMNLDYGHDLNGNPTSVQDALNAADNLEAQYDQLNRLIKQNYVNLPNGSNMYRSYDALGNVLFDRSPEGDVSFTYDASFNRLVSATSTNSSGFGNRIYSYDRLGNVQSDGVRNLTFNAASELTVGSKAGQSKAVTYDGVERIVKEVANGQTHYLIHLGENLILDFNASTNSYTEYSYLGNQLIGSRVVANAATNDTDADGKTDLQEFANPD